MLVSHAADLIVQLCDSALLLNCGSLILQDQPKYLVSQYHKLIYAPPNKQDKIIDDIKQPLHVVHKEKLAPHKLDVNNISNVCQR